eukprot:gene41797-51019_t
MVDYSKFNNIIDSDEEEERSPRHYDLKPSAAQSSIGLPNPAVAQSVNGKTSQPMTKKGKEGRLKFEHEGRTIYEWEQNLTEVLIYIEMPPGVTRKMLDILISPSHLRVGVKGAPPYIDEDTGGLVKISESTWLIEDGEIQITLQKSLKAEAWDCALKGRAGSEIDAFTKEEVKKKLMLERFQEEHPGFDFSGAEFNGQIPDAREFMGGPSHFGIEDFLPKNVTIAGPEGVQATIFHCFRTQNYSDKNIDIALNALKKLNELSSSMKGRLEQQKANLDIPIASGDHFFRLGQVVQLKKSKIRAVVVGWKYDSAE